MSRVTVDLNLLPALEALLEEASVTRAARRLGLSQPALSASLARLRRYYGDELLRRVGNTYELTPLAANLRQRATVALDGVDRVFAAQPVFDPQSAIREFTLLGSDYGMAIVGRAMSRSLAERAPRLRVRLRQHTPDLIDHAAETLRTIDGILLPHGVVADTPSTDLFEDRWMILVATANSLVAEEISMDQLAELPWAMVYHAPTAFAPAARQLQMLGVEPRVQVVIESFFALPEVITGTDRIALVQGRLAQRLTASGDVRVVPCPFDAVPLVMALWWHPMNGLDPAHIWLRELLADACATLGEPGAGRMP
jgi:DNA-binding transcriptional LysR family regulator